LECFRAELQSNLDAFKSKGARQVSDQLRETSAQLADDLRNRAEKAHEACSAQLTASGRAVIEETEKQIAALSQAALVTLRQQAETVHRRTSEFVARDLRKRLDQVADALQQLDAATAEQKDSNERT
jgi:selenocysteine-specific translation elongation factor